MEVRCTSTKRVVSLPDDLVAEILARVPYRSLCQFKCVSRSWKSMCSNPAVHRRCPQTLTGFFYSTISRQFVNATGRGSPMVDPSLPFMPPGYENASFLDSCNGLLLCKCDHIQPQPQDMHTYFVCNPATQKWIGLPELEVAGRGFSFARPFCLGFDPAISTHFRVFVLRSNNPGPPDPWDPVTGVDIFSSETGAWSYRQSEWGNNGHEGLVGYEPLAGWDSVFFNGTLHLTSPGSCSLLTVDMDGRAWGKITTPLCFEFIGLSQGRLLAVRRDQVTISIWVLEDYAGQRWTMKYAFTVMQMFGAGVPQFRPRSFQEIYSFRMHAVHPEHDFIFLTVGRQKSLMSYDLGEKIMHFIGNLGENNLSAHPYIPCFLDWLSDGH